MNIRVLLVEDHRMVREALCGVLNQVSDIEVVGEAGDAHSALEQAAALSPDVVVLDIRLPDLNGIEVAARLRDAGNRAKVVALSGFSDKRFVTALVSELRDGSPAGEAQPLARREREVLRLIAEGLRSPGIADKLHVSLATVEVHRRNIMRKLGLRTVAELTKHAIREGIVSL